MGAKKISQLTSATTPLSGAERIAGVQSGATVGFDVGDILDVPFQATVGSGARTLADRAGEIINVCEFGVGVGTGDATIDTPAILAAYAYALTAYSPELHFPAGQYIFDNATLQINSQARIPFVGYGARILFKRAAVWQLGDGSNLASLNVFFGLDFEVDPGSTAVAPISLYNTGRTTFIDCHWNQIVASGIDLRNGVVVLRGCNPSMATGATSFIHAAIPNTLSAAIFIQGGRYDGKAGMIVVDHSGQGQIDGMVFFGASSSGFGHALISAPVSPGHISNVVAVGNLFDAVDQQAFQFSPGSGAQINDVLISGNKFNSSGASTATSGALITLDLSAGGTHGPYPFVVTGNVFANARRRAVEILGGAYSRVQISRNTIGEYGSSANAASRAIYVDTAATFDTLEIADNLCTTSYAHDYGVEIGAGVTAAKFKIQGNVFSGTAANFADFNTTRFHSVRSVLQADRTYYVDAALGSDSNAGLVAGAGGAFASRQAAWNAIAQLDLNGHNVTVQMADGTYTGAFVATNVPLGQGVVTFQGNSATPANVLVSTTAADCWTFLTGMAANVLVKDMKLQTTTSGNGITVKDTLVLQYSNLVIGTLASAGVAITGQGHGAFITQTGPVTINTTSPFNNFANANNGARIVINGQAITITGNPNITNFYSANTFAHLIAKSITYTGTQAGKQYIVATNGLIDAGGAGASIPGSGTTAVTQGQIV